MPLAAPRVPESFVRRVATLVGEAHVSQAQPARMLYSRDMWPKTLLWQSEGEFPHPPDLVAWPASTAEVAAVVRLSAEEGVPVVPFGGGSGVCGGVVPLRGGISLDLKRMNRFLSLDAESGLAEAECGILGQHLEDQLEQRGHTLGHFPSSIYCSTLGGFLAGRSAGQLSTLYGKIEDMVSSFTCVTGTGDVLDTANVPELNQALVGSEGTLAILTRARMRVHRQAEARRLHGFSFATLEGGLEAIRGTLQRGARPAVVRLYDPLDTFLVGGGKKKEKEKALPVARLLRALNARIPDEARGAAMRAALGRTEVLMDLVDRFLRKSLLILGFEGPREMVEADFQVAREACLGQGARDVGPGPGEAWLEKRYKVSYRQSRIFAAGCFVDTLEVATTWDKLADLYRGVRGALRGRALVMAHFSHSYPEGCSIYFTFVATAPTVRERADLYDRLWADGLEAVQRAGGCLSHHHGVGLSKSRFMAAELGEGMRLYRALKDVFDPQGVLNPGKMGL
jgi:alkyldihydroxyacetonephosphate synthase